MSLTVQKVRDYAKDKYDLNILLNENQQSSDALIELAMEFAISMFNMLQPITQYTEKDFPDDYVLLLGTLHHLCNTEAERQLRNQATYNAQGLNAGIDDKTQLYQQLAITYLQQFTHAGQGLKQYNNVDAAWGGSDSPYRNLFTWKFRSGNY